MPTTRQIEEILGILRRLDQNQLAEVDRVLAQAEETGLGLSRTMVILPSGEPPPFSNGSTDLWATYRQFRADEVAEARFLQLSENRSRLDSPNRSSFEVDRSVFVRRLMPLITVGTTSQWHTDETACHTNGYSSSRYEAMPTDNSGGFGPAHGLHPTETHGRSSDMQTMYEQCKEKHGCGPTVNTLRAMLRPLDYANYMSNTDLITYSKLTSLDVIQRQLTHWHAYESSSDSLNREYALIPEMRKLYMQAYNRGDNLTATIILRSATCNYSASFLHARFMGPYAANLRLFMARRISSPTRQPSFGFVVSPKTSATVRLALEVLRAVNPEDRADCLRHIRGHRHSWRRTAYLNKRVEANALMGAPRELVQAMDRCGWVCYSCGRFLRDCSCNINLISRPARLSKHNDIEFRGGEPARNSCYIPRYVGMEFEICGFDVLGDEPNSGTVKSTFFGAVENKKAIEAMSRSRILSTVDELKATVKGDASLPAGGREFTLSPMRHTKALKDLRVFTDMLRQSGAWVNHRAGGHVHVDVSGMTNAQRKSIFALWFILQDYVIDNLAVGRTEGEYCQRLQPLDGVTASNVVGRRDIFYNNDGSRYLTLNRTSLNDHGTYEFRVFPGTVSYERALVNASVASKIVHFAATAKTRELKKVIRMTPEKLFGYIVGSRTAKRAKKLPIIDYYTVRKVNYNQCAGLQETA